MRTTQSILPAILPARAAPRSGSGAGCRRTVRGALLLVHMACALAAAPAAAMQVLDAVDHAELTAEVSATAVSRIALGNDRIARVIRAPGGFETEHDPGSGDLYLRPLGTRDAGAGMDDTGDDPPETAPVSLFIGTEKGFTYRLTLAVAERGSAQILIRNAAAQDPVRNAPAAGDPRIGALVRLIGAVARREPLPGYAIEAAAAGPDGAAGPVFGTLETWRGPRFEVLVVEIPDRMLVGETPGGPLSGGPGDAAAVAARLGPGIAAAWLAGPGTGPSGGRIAVTVRERAAPVSGGTSR